MIEGNQWDSGYVLHFQTNTELIAESYSRWILPFYKVTDVNNRFYYKVILLALI